MNKLKPVIQQLCVHDVLWEDVMVAYHDNNGHIGRERLYETLKQRYHYPQMYTSVLEYVSTCKECQKTKTSPHRRKAPLSPLPIVEPFGRIHLDHIGPLPQNSEGFRHLPRCFVKLFQQSLPLLRKQLTSFFATLYAVMVP